MKGVPARLGGRWMFRGLPSEAIRLVGAHLAVGENPWLRGTHRDTGVVWPMGAGPGVRGPAHSRQTNCRRLSPVRATGGSAIGWRCFEWRRPEQLSQGLSRSRVSDMSETAGQVF